MVPEQVTTYRLVVETSLEEKKQVQYKPIWNQELKPTPRLVSKPVIGSDGRLYMENSQQMQNLPVWTYRMAPQEVVVNVPQVRAYWKQQTLTRVVPKQVPVGSPAPPSSVEDEEGQDPEGGEGHEPGPNGSGKDGSNNNGSGKKGDQKKVSPKDFRQMKEELLRLQQENETLKETLSEVLRKRK